MTLAPLLNTLHSRRSVDCLWRLPGGSIIGLLVPILLIPFGQSLYLPAACAQDEAPTTTEYRDDFVFTRDGVKLYYRFYPGRADKETVPIILIHDWEGAGSDMYPLAEFLSATDAGEEEETKAPGHAVIVPDVRGHGRSTEITLRPGAEPEEIRADKMRPADVQAVVPGDLQAVKKILREQHNAGKLNIELLGVVGVGNSTPIAVNWALFDWSVRPLPSYKLGQYVKAIALVSPVAAFKGLRLQPALTRGPIGSDQVSILLVYGAQDAQQESAASRLFSILKRRHPQDLETREERLEKQSLFDRPLDTSLAGMKLLAGPGLSTSSDIAAFINLRLANKKDEHRWEPRENPLSD
ncbi:MAG: hypothetical protein KDA60_07600 [Planctomycetales bacterium]|nr:hypothetical protein [Planctomycetales bacterium]